MEGGSARSAWAPGRVNLMGDHTDHTGGLVLPMAIDLGTTVTGVVGGDEVRLRSGTEPREAIVPLDVGRPEAVEPGWARYVAGIVAELRPDRGFSGSITTTLPVGAGLSSSAALEVAVALALGFDGEPVELALLCQRAEQRASGVPCGIMDQLASAAGAAGAALRIDCSSLELLPVPLPDDLDVLVVDSGERRSLAGSAYAERVSQCRAAEALVGPLSRASAEEVELITDTTLRRRARHVVSENARVDAFSAALRSFDIPVLAETLGASHSSLRDDFEVSTPRLDSLVQRLASTEGVIGARLTGAGFGGCVVALLRQGAEVDLPERSWRVRASAGAAVTSA